MCSLWDRLSGLASPHFQRVRHSSQNLPFLGHVKAFVGIDKMDYFVEKHSAKAGK
jgi:hypothetical protein